MFHLPLQTWVKHVSVKPGEHVMKAIQKDTE